jgi:hypothetical protein
MCPKANNESAESKKGCNINDIVKLTSSRF